MVEQLKGTLSTREIAARTDTVVDGKAGPSAGRSRRFSGFEEADALLRSLADDALNAPALRAAMAGVDGLHDLSRLDADEARRLAGWMFDDRSLLDHRHDF